MTLCMGRIRKEMRGRPPHAGRCSISLRTSRKAALLLLLRQRAELAEGRGVARRGRAAGGDVRPPRRRLLLSPGPTHVSFCRARCW